MTLHFTIPGVPVAQPRARTARGKSRPYNDRRHPVNTFKALVALSARQAYSGPLLEGPLGLSAQFVFDRPGRLRRKKDPAWRLRKFDKPDADNLLKAVLDGLKGVLWTDDAQVQTLFDVSKWYVATGEAPQTTVLVECLT